MRKLLFYIANFCTLICFILIAFPNTYLSNSLSQTKSFGKQSIQHIEFLSQTPRISGTASITFSQKYIKNEFQKYGYETIEQSFNWPIDKFSKQSKNIIAIKKGINEKQIIIGAHYDSTNTNGADDNASGVGVVLELAEKLNRINLPYTIKFVAFDAEEVGIFGSRYFVKHMSENEKKNTLLYINIDSILSGDNLYIYGDSGDRGWFKNEVLSLSKKENLGIKTSSGIIPKNEKEICILPEECFDYSDHVYFKQENIPYAYFESSNLNSLNRQTGYPKYRSQKFGMVIHSENDNLDFIKYNFKNSYQNNLNKCIYSIYTILTNQDHNIIITTNVKNKSYLENIKYELYKNNTIIKILNHNDSNKIKIQNLKSGTYKIKQINNSPANFICNFESSFKICSNNTGTLNILYEDGSLIPKTKEYDGILIEIYGDNFNDKESNIDELYKTFIKINNLPPKVIYENIYSIEEIKKSIDQNNSIIQTFSNTVNNNLTTKTVHNYMNPKIILIITLFILIFMSLKNKDKQL